MHNEIWKELEKYNYPAKSGLDFINEFTFIVGIVLSAQSRDAFINTQTPPLFEVADDPYKMESLGLDGIAHYIQKIGLWRSKAKYIYNLSKKIIEFIEIRQKNDQYQWHESFFDKAIDDDAKLYSDPISQEGLPSFRLGLMELPGVGRKGANVFLNVIYGAPVYPVDTHVMKVGSRLGLISEKTPYNIELELKDSVPHQYAPSACHWLVWHGRNVCTAPKPKCQNCNLKDLCPFFLKNKA
jgi:endonuclease-3